VHAFAGTGTDKRRRVGVEGQYAASTGGMTLMRKGFEGGMSPGFVFDAISDPSTGVVELPLNAVPTEATNTQVFSILRDGGIVKFGLNDNIIDSTVTITPETNSLNTSDNHDILVHKDSSGTERVFYSYETDGGGSDSDIGVMDNDEGNQDDDYFSSRTGGANLTGGVPLKMWVGPDSNVYCTNGRYVAVYDTLTDIANAQALDLGANWIATSGAQFKNYNAIVAYHSSSAIAVGSTSIRAERRVKVVLWNGYDPRYNFQYEIPDNLSGAIEAEGEDLRVWTTGRSETLKCWQFNGNGFGRGPLFEIASDSSVFVPRHGSVTRFRNHSVFPGRDNADNILFAFGSTNPLVEPSGLHGISETQDTWGFVKELDSSVGLYVGGFDGGSTYTIRKLNNAKYNTSSQLNTRTYTLPTNSVITAIKFYFWQFGSGAKMEVGLYKNGDASTQQFGGGSVIELLQTEVESNFYHAITEEIPDVNAFMLFLSYTHAVNTDTAAIIRRIEVEYKFEDNTI
jgi:hypothetical protein